MSTFRHGKGAPVSLKSATQDRTTGHSVIRSSPAAKVANAITAVKPAAIKRIEAFLTLRPAALLRAPLSSRNEVFPREEQRRGIAAVDGGSDALRNRAGSCIAERRFRGIGDKRGDEDGHEASGR